MADEELRVHVVRAVVGVGVDDQLRIWHVLLHDERVHRGYVHVVTAVHDECRTPHLPIASTWAGDTFSLTSGSRPT